MFRKLAFAAALAAFSCGACVRGWAEDAPKPKVLLIGKEPDHPYGSHMYLHVAGVLAQCLEQNGAECVVSSGWPKAEARDGNARRQLAGVKTIVVYTSPAAELLLDGPQRDEVDQLMKQGVGLVTIHWASSVNKANLERLGPTWLSYLGGTWVSNVGLSGGKSPLKQLAPDHPICRGWKEYEIEDEYYLNPTITEKATPLLQVKESGGKDVIVGWAFEREKDGRSFGTTLGHPYSNFQRDDFRRMLVNAILWTAHAEVPAEGAKVTLSEEELKLPPKE